MPYMYGIMVVQQLYHNGSIWRDLYGKWEMVTIKEGGLNNEMSKM
jgi:hypothetical protein